MSTEQTAPEGANVDLATELRTSAEADHVMRYDHELMLRSADRIEALEECLCHIIREESENGSEGQRMRFMAKYARSALSRHPEGWRLSQQEETPRGASEAGKPG